MQRIPKTKTPKKTNKLGGRMIKQLLNSVIAKYRDLTVSRGSIICLGLRLRQITDLLAADKSRYFPQRRPIVVNYSYSNGWTGTSIQWRLLRGISIEFEKTPPHQPLLHVSASPTVRIRISPIAGAPTPGTKPGCNGLLTVGGGFNKNVIETGARRAVI